MLILISIFFLQLFSKGGITSDILRNAASTLSPGQKLAVVHRSASANSKRASLTCSDSSALILLKSPRGHLSKSVSERAGRSSSGRPSCHVRPGRRCGNTACVYSLHSSSLLLSGLSWSETSHPSAGRGCFHCSEFMRARGGSDGWRLGEESEEFSRGSNIKNKFVFDQTRTRCFIIDHTTQLLQKYPPSVFIIIIKDLFLLIFTFAPCFEEFSHT